MTADTTEVGTVARGRIEGDAAVVAEVRPVMAARWRRWYVEDALPFWRDRGLADGNGLFLERLTLTGEPVRDAVLRVRTQARQIFCFATACAHGLDPQGGELARLGFERLWRCAQAQTVRRVGCTCCPPPERCETPAATSTTTLNRTGFPGGPDFWKDGVHDEQDDEIEGVSGGAA
jgi:hypothetical protein